MGGPTKGPIGNPISPWPVWVCDQEIFAACGGVRAWSLSSETTAVRSVLRPPSFIASPKLKLSQCLANQLLGARSFSPIWQVPTMLSVFYFGGLNGQNLYIIFIYHTGQQPPDPPPPCHGGIMISHSTAHIYVCILCTHTWAACAGRCEEVHAELAAGRPLPGCLASGRPRPPAI